MFSSMRAWTNRWANSRYTGDLRRHGAHCDVTVIMSIHSMVFDIDIIKMQENQIYTSPPV